MGRSLVFLLTLFVFSFSFANIDSILDNVVNTTSTHSGTYKSPTTTTATLGSYSFRLKTDALNLPIFTIQSPRATLSCSGFDFDAGFISYLNLDTLQSLLEQAGTSLAWGVVLGLVYSIPGVAQTFQYLNELGRYSQMLNQNACQIGVQLGKSAGSTIFHRAKNEAESNAVASGIKSTFGEAIKSYKNFLKVNKLFYTFPYTYLNEAGYNDNDIKNLIAGFFGIYDWKPYDTNGGICHSKSCLDAKFVRTLAKPPKINTIDTLLNGGNVKVYTCSWTTLNVGGQIVNACTAFKEANLNVREGLIDKVYKKIDRIVNDLYNGNVITPSDAAFLNTYGGLTNIINALVLIKRERPQVYSLYARAVAEKVALISLKSLIYSARTQLISNAYPNMVDKASKEALDEIYKRFSKADKAIRDRLKEIKEDIHNLDNLAIVYSTIKADLEGEMKQKIGPYLLIAR